MKNVFGLFIAIFLASAGSFAQSAENIQTARLQNQRLPSLNLPANSPTNLQSSMPFGKKLIRCSALLGGMLAFEFIPDFSGSITSVKIVAPDRSHIIPVVESWTLQPNEIEAAFPLSKVEKKYIQRFAQLTAVRAKNHSFRWETFVWGAKDSRTGEEFGVLLHKQNNVITPIRFGNCKAI